MKNKVEQLRESIDKIREFMGDGGAGIEFELQKNPKVASFLKKFNYQPFDDWYREYDNYVSGDRISDPEQFIEDTKSIMDFLKKVFK